MRVSVSNNVHHSNYASYYRNLTSYYPISCQDFIAHYCHVNEIYNVPRDLFLETSNCIVMLYWDFLQNKPNFTFYKKKILEHCVHRERFDIINHLAAIIIQRKWKQYRQDTLNIRHKAALIIQQGMHNWLWKPVCKDGTFGINLRLGLKMIQDMKLR
jgi:hypothetical protein